MRRALPPTVVSACLAITIAGTAGAQEPTLATVLERAGAYVVEFQRQLSGIVAEEQYVQEVAMPPDRPHGITPRAYGPLHRTLKSDLLLVRPQGSDRWIQLRDVFEVDGRVVRDRADRLMKLFLQPTSSTARQVDAIRAESARYNIGGVQRTVNVPTLALRILDPATQPRFRFTRTRDRKPTLITAPAQDAAWVVDYEEVRPGTVIRTVDARDLPIRGRLWIDPESGRVLITELTARESGFRAVVDVRYKWDPLVELLLPVEMRERFDVLNDGSRVDGRAAYGRVRRFQVMVDEKFAPIVRQ